MTNVLFICGKARKRSPTAVHVAGKWQNIRSDCAGLSRDADDPVTIEHLEWADVIMVMETRQKKRLSSLYGSPPAHVKTVVLDIPDRYEFMDQALIVDLVRKLSHHFGPPD